MLGTISTDQKLRACMLAARSVPKSQPIQQNPARPEQSFGKPALEMQLAGAGTCGATIEWVSAQDVIPIIVGIRPPTNRVKGIARAACKHFGVTIGDMMSGQRQWSICRPRQIAMYLARKLTRRSLPDIGRQFNGRDHTTVLNAVWRVETLINTDPQLAADVAAVRALAVAADPGLGQ